MSEHPRPPVRNETGFVDGLIAIAGRLVALMERETALLRKMRPGEIGDLQEEKLRLVRGYESLAEEIRENPARVAALSRVVRDELRSAVARFEAAAEDNARALTAAQEANERLLKAIIDAASAKSADTSTYASDGALRKPRDPDAHGVSLTLNREF